MAIRTEHLGPEHPETLEALTFQVRVLGRATKTHGAKQEVIRLGRQVARSQLRLLGPQHPSTLRAQYELGAACAAHGDFEEAHRILAPTFAAQEAVLGAAALESLSTLHSLAVVLHGLGRLDQAEESLRRVTDLRRRGQGPLHPDTLGTLADLALVVQDRGRTDEAVALLREAVAGWQAFHGSPYFHGARYLCDLLVADLRERGDWAGIRELCEGWLRDLLALPPEPDKNIRELKMVSLSCMAFWLTTLPEGVPFDGELALEAAGRAAELGRDFDNNWTRLALVRLRLGQAEPAERALAESMARHAGGNPFDWMACALILARQGELDRAREAFDRAPRTDKGTGPGVGYADVRNKVAALIGIAPQAVVAPRGPRLMRDEGAPRPLEPGGAARD